MKHLRLIFALGGAALTGLSVLAMRWDVTLMQVFYVRPYGLISVARVASSLGWWLLMTPVAVLLLAVLWRPGWTWLSWRPALALVLGEIAAEALKLAILRPRPEALALGDFSGAAFPSDRALVGLAFWMTIALVIGELWPEGRLLLITLAGLAGLLIGWSQVFVGVHWPADVVAGWGMALLLLALPPPPQPPKAGRIKAKK